MTITRFVSTALLVLPVSLAAIGQAHAQSSAAAPGVQGKPVRLITTYPPGGASDIMARIIARKLEEIRGQTIIVENKSGANGSLGLEYAARQPADGSSFVIGNLGPVSINPQITKVPYDIVRDFQPVTLVASAPTVLIVTPGLPAMSLMDLVALARAKPGTINYGTAGAGTLGHLGGEMMKRLAKIDMVHVPYKGGVLAIQDVLGGHVQMMFADPQPVLPHIRAGKARGLAVTSAKRSPVAPDIPTFAEAGLPGFVAENWWGVYVPAATPKPLIDKLQADLVATMASTEVKQKFAEMAVDAQSSTPEALRDFARAETERWGKLIQEAGIRGE